MITFDLIDVYMFHFISTSHLGKSGGCGCCSMVEEMNSILTDYKNKTKTIEEILKSCVCQRHGHQYCIPTEAVNNAVANLLNSTFVNEKGVSAPLVDGGLLNATFSDFEELYDFVRGVIGGVKGIGPLTVYDTAKRIGHLYPTPIYPKQYVYLAAGALDGAKALLGRSDLKFREPVCLFTPYFGSLSSIFVEDILCIFKDDFAGLSTAPYPNLVKKGSGILFCSSKEVSAI